MNTEQTDSNAEREQSERVLKLEELQQPAEQNKEMKQTEDEDEEYESQITINEDTVNQLLTLHLLPGHSIWHKGEIIVSNRPLPAAPAFIDPYQIVQNIKFMFKAPQKIKNTERTLAYYCLRKKGGGGKILHLKREVYAEDFYVDMDRVLTINYPTEKYTVSKNSKLLKLSKFNFTEPAKKFEVTLQALKGNIILEKSMGPGERIYVGIKSVMAMSEKIGVKREINSVCLTGPGFVFIESDSPYDERLGRNNYLVGRIILLFFLFLTLIAFKIDI